MRITSQDVYLYLFLSSYLKTIVPHTIELYLDDVISSEYRSILSLFLYQLTLLLYSSQVFLLPLEMRLEDEWLILLYQKCLDQ